MFIQTELTPNPAVIKFLPGQSVIERGVAEFTSKDEALRSPLAQNLFDLDGVSGVFYGRDFISVTKAEEQDWDTLKPRVLAAVMEHYSTGQPLFHGEVEQKSQEPIEEDEISAQIRELIETRVRPMVAQDGGDIVFERFENGIAFLQLRGACAGCPSATMTLKSGIENMLRHYVPEVQEVQAVNGI